MPFFLIFILLPIAEIYTFIGVGKEIGVSQTLLFCLVTALIGGFLVRKQGVETLMSGHKALSAGEFPLEHLFTGFCIVISGALLVTPGFLTDIFGFSLLIEPVRKFLQTKIMNSSKFSIHTMSDGNPQSARTHSPYGAQDGDIIEGDYEEIPDEKIDNKK